MIHDAYGSPELLKLREIDQPTIGDDEILVRVHAAGLNPADCFSVRGEPFVVRMMTGLLKPRHGVPGLDMAGQVTAVGKSVRMFKPGDEVFGSCNGSCAEYASTKENQLAPKPANLTPVQAAALSTAGLAALHGLRDAGKLQAGQKVLINGAAGGVGTFAVQIAKAFGAEVTGVCGTANVELVRSLGADQVVDYTREDFTQREERYDLILDNVENRSLSECRRVLTPRGTLIVNSGTGASGMKLMIRLLKPLVVSPFVSQNLRRYVSMPNHADLVVLKDLAESGKLTPVVNQTYPLSRTPEALLHIEGGHARGKVVITL
ncbi:MAG TPA: NAD(P)-dependent alcohol dehydrogenase [Hyalangium sp.]|nr:NAD(P)-dependent alcohol dehydrogenase [Hyalangium sp.]